MERVGQPGSVKPAERSDSGGTPILCVENLTVQLGDRIVLESVSLDVRPGDFIAIIGPNGGGKTTLLRAILGLVPRSSGSITLFGGSPEEMRSRVGYLPQRTNFDADFPLTGREVVASGRLVGWFGRRRTMRAVEEALEQVGMVEHADRPIGAYSGGQLQRILLARALVGRPELLLLDEPTAHVDPQFHGSFYDLLERLCENTPILLTTHDIGAVSTYVKSVGCLSRRLHYHGTRELTHEMLEHAYGCPVDIVAHAVPHRLLDRHERSRATVALPREGRGDAP